MKNIRVWRQKITAAVAVVLLLVAIAPALHVSADLESCTANVSPQSVTPGSDNSFVFGINNTSTNPISWLKISSPNTAFFTVASASAYQWQANTTNSDATFDQGSLNSGGQLNFSVEVIAGNNTTSPLSWTVQASDNPSGSNAITCGGDTGVSIEIQPVQLEVTNVHLTSLSDTAVTVLWDTNKPASSTVYYGDSENYGSQEDNGTLTTSHSITLNNLTANTGYHYQVSSTDSDNNTVMAADNTFLTAIQGSISSGPTPITTKIPIKAVPTEKIPPTITIATNFTKPQKSVPTISGSAADNEALAAIEYSLDGGKNWLPVDKAPGLGTKKSEFSFTPQNLQDGNYQVVARAIDTSGNQTTTPAQTLIIDRLPPIVGGNVMYIGSQIVEPNADGVVVGLVGVDQKITLSAVGGATSITLTAAGAGNKTSNAQNFTLTQSKDTGLWSGVMSFNKQGTYALTAKAVDGAGNTTNRALNNVQVQEAGKAVDAKTGKDVNATVTTYYRAEDTNNWTVWDGQAYSQDNPVATNNKQHNYGYYLPAGTYYVRVSAPGYKTVITNSFTLDRLTGLSSTFRLSHKPGLDLGPLHVRLPWPSWGQTPLNLSNKTASGNTSKSQPLPQFSLRETNGTTLKTSSLYGKPTILTFVSTWALPARDQLAILADTAIPALNIVPVSSGESLAKLTAYADIAGYPIPILADSDNQLADSLKLSSLPVHYFIDRHGVVKKVKVGVLSKEELLKNVEL